MSGWRPIRDSDQPFLAERAQTQKRQARQQLRSLRREWPELFDGQGRPLPDPEEES